jgi:hypothetical protein
VSIYGDARECTRSMEYMVVYLLPYTSGLRVFLERGHAEGTDFTRVAGDGLKFARARRVPFPALCIRFKCGIYIMRFGVLILGNDV